MTQQQIKAMLAEDSTRSQALDELGEWAKSLCLIFSASPSTAYRVAALFVEGIEASYEDRPADMWGERFPDSGRVEK